MNETEPSPALPNRPGTRGLERPEVMPPSDHTATDVAGEVEETVDHPTKVMRIGTMLKQLLEEVRSADLDEASRHRLRFIYERSIVELGSTLSSDLRAELARLTSPFEHDETPSVAELQVAKAQLVGWLEGLIQGMQAMLFAQHVAARRQLAGMRGELPLGASQPGADHPPERPGTYL